jgi:4-hydroxythreonine-4-phosphate dehydrogenase
MMLSAKDLRTVPITVHIAICDVPAALTTQLIIEKTQETAKDLTRRFGLEKPAIAMTGLNPHAGEGGAMGTEEITVITPAIAALKDTGMDVTGPLPADTLFHQEARAGFDVIMCMYHDQALIPVKTLDFHGGVNTTLGLPFIRTSPDHGTALNLASKGVANPSSLTGAIKQAAQMAARDTG